VKILLPHENLVEVGINSLSWWRFARANNFRVVKKISIHDMCDLCQDGKRKKSYLINLCCVTPRHQFELKKLNKS
jgi:hypothetical protein